MIQTDAPAISGAISASERLQAARSHEPHPLHPRPSEVISYVAEVQRADAELGRSAELMPATASQSELDAIARKRAGADAAIARQVSLAGRRLGRDREGSLAALNAIFNMGTAPKQPLDGRYRGELVTTTLRPAIDAFSSFLARLWLPWLGKRFNAASSTGDNVFTPSAPRVGRLIWPTYFDYRPYKRGLSTSFIFNTYIGPGVKDPQTSTLKLDYDNDKNPGFLIRIVLDELVQVSGNYYLGKAYLKLKGDYTLAAYFALRKQS